MVKYLKNCKYLTNYLNLIQKENKSDYQAFKNKVNTDNKVIQNVEELINMDV